MVTFAATDLTRARPTEVMFQEPGFSGSTAGDLASTPDFGGIDEVLFDLSDIRALQEDVDKVHERIRKNVAAGLQSWEEGRDGIGLDPNPKEGTFLIPANIVPTQREDLEEPPEPPEPVAPPPKALPEPVMDIVAEPQCPDCGRRVGKNVNVGASLPCPRCRDYFLVEA